MVLYDFQHMFKRLLIVYIALIALHLIFFRGDSAGGLLILLGLLISAGVNFRLYYRDYIGKNALLINTLPMGGFYKTLSKLLWGVLFSVMFYCVFTAASIFVLKRGLVLLNALSLCALILFFLNGYTAMGAFKHFKGFYFTFTGILFFNAVTVFIGAAVYMLAGFTALLAAVVIMCIFQLLLSIHNLER